MIEGHGDDTHQHRVNLLHNFSSNVFYKGCPTELLNKIASQVHIVQNYPSPAAQELNVAGANKHDVLVDQFLFTNGATEAFYLIAQAFAGKRAAILAPTFSEYEDACKIHGLHYELVNTTDLEPSAYDLVFICNPNNPDGSIIPTKELIALIDHTPTTTFVIDEAYIEFTDQLTSLATHLKTLPNLMLVRSLTKTFTIPGLRLGYVMASTAIIQLLRNRKMPWSVNALAIQAGLQLFSNYDRWQFDVKELLKETQAFIQMFSVLDWLEVMPTYTSYFLVKLLRGSASELKKYLVTEHGILIRDATNFHGLEGEYIRLATQSPEANESLINALKKWN